MPPALIFAIAWIVMILSWIAAAFWSSRTENSVKGADAWIYRIIIVAGAILFAHKTSELIGAHRLYHIGAATAYALAFVTIAGFIFAWWARIHLGALWSGSVTRKQNHHIIETGPYALVRHPIYTGAIAATVATTAAKATWPALIGCALIIFGLWLKATIEERFLAAEFGSGDYAAYRSRVAMLIPFLL
jgi:protein-S-isoprenylcysteine O-methyltransferase Ste14